MSGLQSQLNDWSPSSAGSPEMAEHLLTLYEEEGLEGFMDMAYGFAALAYSAVGDANMAMLYAEKAKEAILMKDGKWTRNLAIWDSLMEDLQEHWSWRRRL
ncbi:uncharacterized protein SETTUDRAFT_96933 [Exserohilum turcica Et28A]|uniref:Uncharacterized protein n=1 Tax=Exserohilum turcicum (strain 28A) TaxID=671987 RepID=R0JXW6_EXST2|nr:uncharacterized protein SETTUDRAFT_96933 [Exserohilum turcica Et28A]EOA82339.1 hypothetical protein SETTUDRAFT_96933 [Exserohilum turcica Et28A]